MAKRAVVEGKRHCSVATATKFSFCDLFHAHLGLAVLKSEWLRVAHAAAIPFHMFAMRKNDVRQARKGWFHRFIAVVGNKIALREGDFWKIIFNGDRTFNLGRDPVDFVPVHGARL